MCSEMVKMIPEYVNNELSETQLREFSNHLSVCSDCQAALEDYRLVYGKSRLSDEYEEIPDLVAVTMNRIKTSTSINEVSLRKKGMRWLRPVMIAVPVILIILILIDFLMWYFPGQPGPSSSTRIVSQPGDELFIVSPTYPRFNLNELISRADAIVIGTVTEILPSQWGTFAQEEIIYTDVIVEVDRFLYGEPGSEKIAVRLLGGRVGDVAVLAEDVPEYTLGEDVFLFLYKNILIESALSKEISPQNYYTTWSKQDKYRYWHGIIDNRGDNRFPMCTWFVQMRIAAIHGK